MKRIILLFLISFLFAGHGWSAISNEEDFHTDFNYFFGPGDMLDIKVWRHPDLDMKVTVRPDCGISYPIVHEINVCDLSIPELRQRMTEGLKGMITDPEVTVNVLEFQSQKIFVLGEVHRPGLYPFEGRVNILDAITRAGSYTHETAALKTVMVIRKGTDGKPQAIKVNFWDIIKNAKIKENIPLKNGDIIFVPRTVISEVNSFIDRFLTKTDPALQYYLDILDIKRGGRQVTIQ